MQIIHYKEVESTNTKIKELSLENADMENTAILTDFQSNGKGQGINYWHSKAEMNLLCSVLFKLDLKAHDHFRIVMAVSLILKDFLSKINIPVKIKWPNDIYFKDKKLIGILIENCMLGSYLKQSIIGIGINVNQENFPDEIPNPISLKQITSKDFDIGEIFTLLISDFELKFEDYLYHKKNLLEEYTCNLYRLNSFNRFKTLSGYLTGKITGVKETGDLIIRDNLGKENTFLHGEITYMI